MDGNRRWASRKGFSSAKGHEEGFQALVKLLRAYPELKKEHGAHHYIFYAFSTENWKRSKEEVSALMELLSKGLSKIEEELQKISEKPRIRFIGDLSSFSPHLQKEMAAIEERTKTGKGTVVLALSYGGRDEIVRAAKTLTTISEESMNDALDTAGIPDPDMIIRTGGEKRLSNFLLWQAAYSELFFVDTLWPDFTKDALVSCIKEYNGRERRHGI